MPEKIEISVDLSKTKKQLLNMELKLSWKGKDWIFDINCKIAIYPRASANCYGQKTCDFWLEFCLSWFCFEVWV